MAGIVCYAKEWDSDPCGSETWACRSCGQEVCATHGHRSGLGENALCVPCDRDRMAGQK